MRTINNTATLAFYTARKQEGDLGNISNFTGYSKSHISNITAGRRRVTTNVADAMFFLTCFRAKNSTQN